MKMYLPSWNGDFRLEGTSGGKGSVLTMHDLTPAERLIVGKFLFEAKKKKWVKEYGDVPKAKNQPYEGSAQSIDLDVTLEKASPVLIKLARPKDRTLTAVRFSGGRMETIEGTGDAALVKVETTVAEAARTEKKDEPAAAASVKRPTPSCPQCMPGAVEPATEVLLSFLDPQQHEDWSKDRAIIVEGGLTGHRYLLAHRNTQRAAQVGRICYDLDDDAVVHFHDWSVPPEEEVLAAKLILEHREPWLRNEATLFGLMGTKTEIFKNPFGDMGDGIESANFAQTVGNFFLGTMTREERKKVGRYYS